MQQIPALFSVIIDKSSTKFEAPYLCFKLETADSNAEFKLKYSFGRFTLDCIGELSIPMSEIAEPLADYAIYEINKLNIILPENFDILTCLKIAITSRQTQHIALLISVRDENLPVPFEPVLAEIEMLSDLDISNHNEVVFHDGTNWRSYGNSSTFTHAERVIKWKLVSECF
ncbi:MAG: hypothetical protein M0R17_03965 [Candidatus Omnitrophica bacterium]|jgi:hypothetical protein|nr:hypothetical protein [Candidatus Omnitrophota bacterium]